MVIRYSSYLTAFYLNVIKLDFFPFLIEKLLTILRIFLLRKEKRLCFFFWTSAKIELVKILLRFQVASAFQNFKTPHGSLNICL